MIFVYVLEKADYAETGFVVGVFATSEAAMQHVKAKGWEVTETCDDGSQPWGYKARYGEPCAWEIQGDWTITRWEVAE